MKFYFRDKSEFEYEIITDILSDNSVRYLVKKYDIPVFTPFGDECEIYISIYDIAVDTSLEMFDYIKFLVKKK